MSGLSQNYSNVARRVLRIAREASTQPDNRNALGLSNIARQNSVAAFTQAPRRRVTARDGRKRLLDGIAVHSRAIAAHEEASRVNQSLGYERIAEMHDASAGAHRGVKRELESELGSIDDLEAFRRSLRENSLAAFATAFVAFVIFSFVALVLSSLFWS